MAAALLQLFQNGLVEVMSGAVFCQPGILTVGAKKRLAPFIQCARSGPVGSIAVWQSWQCAMFSAR